MIQFLHSLGKHVFPKATAKRLPCGALGFFLLLAFLALPGLGAQTRSPQLDLPSEIVYPSNFRENGSFPVLVFLPYTGGSAREQAVWFGIAPGAHEDFILVLPQGRYESTDYLPNFVNFARWFAQRVEQDLQALLRRPGVDAQRVYLAGYSLGGDLSWALPLINPELYAGAVLAGTRASYPVAEAALTSFRNRQFRAAFVIGDREEAVRRNGLNFARSRLDSEGLETWFSEYPGGHTNPPSRTVQQALAFVTQESFPVAGSTGERAPWSATTGPLPEGPVALASGPDSSAGQRAGNEAGTGQNGTAGRNETASNTGSSTVNAENSSSGNWVQDFLLRESRDQVALRAYLPWALVSEGLEWSPSRESHLRLEGGLGQFWFRSRTGWLEEGSRLGPAVNHRLRQEAALAYGPGSWLLGGGLSWDWFQGVSLEPGQDGSLPVLYNLPTELGLAALLIHRPAGQSRADLGLEFIYRIPMTLDPFRAEYFFNGEVQAFWRLWNLFVLEARAGSLARLTGLVPPAGDWSTALEQELSWGLSLGLRVPGPFLWILSYEGGSYWKAGDSALEPALWRLGLEYSW